MKHARTAIALTVAALSGTVQANLLGRDINGAAVAGSDASAVFLYDDVLNVTWLRDANANGQMNWDAATTWAANLTVGAFDDWRLPTMIADPNATFSFGGGTDHGYNVRTKSGDQTQYQASQTVYSEMAHLWYSTLGNLSVCNPVGSTTSICAPQAGSGLTRTGDFQNLQPDYYWSGQEYALSASDAWAFGAANGVQFYGDKSLTSLYAMAVRPGDVAPIPEPSTYALMLAGLGAVAFATRRRERRASV